MPESLHNYLNIIRIHRSCFEKEYDLSILNSDALTKLVKINFAGISFYQKILEEIKALENSSPLIEDLTNAIIKRQEQINILTELINQRYLKGEPPLILFPAIPLVKYNETIQINQDCNMKAFFDKTLPDYSLVTVFNQDDAIVYEVDEDLMADFIDQLSNAKGLNLVANNYEEIDVDDNYHDSMNMQNKMFRRIGRIHFIVELFVISPVAYEVFCEYTKIFAKYVVVGQKTDRLIPKQDIVEDYMKRLIAYLQDDSTAFSHFEEFINKLFDSGVITLKEKDISSSLQKLIIQDKISGKVHEQLQKPQILKLAEENGFVQLKQNPNKLHL